MAVINGSPLLLREAAAAGGSYQISRSLRFNQADTTYLSRAFTLGDRRRWTWAGWVKRSNIAEIASVNGENDVLWESRVDGNNISQINFTNSDQLQVFNYVSSDYSINWKTTRHFRDNSSWFHVCISYDGTSYQQVWNGVRGDIKIFINGVQETAFITSDPASNNDEDEYMFNTANTHQLGRRQDGSSPHFNGYLADVYWIDGLALNPAAFGSFDSNTGVWNPKAFTRPAPNDGTTWSGKGSGTLEDANSAWTKLFTGYTTTSGGAVPASGSTLTWEPDDPITCSEFAVWCQVEGTTASFQVNDVEYFPEMRSALGNQTWGWYRIPGLTSLSKVTWSAASGTKTQPTAFRCDGVILKDGATDPTTRTNPNTARTWSSQLTESSGNGFDSTDVEGYSFNGSRNSARVDGTTTASDYTEWAPDPGVAYSGSVEIWVPGFENGDYNFNDEGWEEIDNSEVKGFISIATGSGTINSIKFRRVARAGYNAGSTLFPSMVRVDGHVLIDGADDNSCHLKFSNTSSDAALGTDSFGNGTWDVSGLKAADSSNPENIDSLVDTPNNYGTGTSGGVLRGNYCTFNPLSTKADLSQGNLEIKADGGYDTAIGTIGADSGKWYAEFLITGDPGGYSYAGIADPSHSLDEERVGNKANAFGCLYYNNSSYSGEIKNNSSTLFNPSSLNTVFPGIAMVAMDIDAKKIWYGWNGTWFANGSGTGNPATGANPMVDSHANFTDGFWTWAASPYYTNNVTMTLNAGQREFKHTPPTGFKALCTQNLPDTFDGEDEEFINNPSKYFKAKTWVGKGGDRDVKGFNFQPDLVIIKNREEDGQDFSVHDAERGATKPVYLNADSQETTQSSNVELKQFYTNGFEVGDNNRTNQSEQKFIGWAWNAPTHQATNSSKDVPSDGYYSTPGGFAIVKYTADANGYSAGNSVYHPLNAAPKFIIQKRTNGTSNWETYTTVIDGSYDQFIINNQDDKADSSQTLPAANEFNSTWSDGQVGITYLWAPVAGYSAFGKYVGNHETNNKAPFIYTGFKPGFILIKGDVQGEDWIIIDTARNPNNHGSPFTLFTNVADDEQDTGTYNLDIHSNGFKIQNDNPRFNSDGETYIYAAFAEHPLKIARAR